MFPRAEAGNNESFFFSPPLALVIVVLEVVDLPDKGENAQSFLVLNVLSESGSNDCSLGAVFPELLGFGEKLVINTNVCEGPPRFGVKRLF